MASRSKVQVWVSGAMNDPRQFRPFTNSFHPNDELNEVALQYGAANDDGEALGPECFPKAIWGSKSRGATTFKSLPDIVFGYGFWFVSERCAEVLRQFDLGGGALYPVKVLQKDQETPVGDHPWYCINFGNRKAAFQKNETNPSSFIDIPTQKFVNFSNAKDEWIAVGKEALSKPDLWVDPAIKKALVVSGPLGLALQLAKCASGWSLAACRVVES